MLPIFIVHFYLPKAHGQAPISGSIIFAGLLLKIGVDWFIQLKNKLLYRNQSGLHRFELWGIQCSHNEISLLLLKVVY